MLALLIWYSEAVFKDNSNVHQIEESGSPVTLLQGRKQYLYSLESQ